MIFMDNLLNYQQKIKKRTISRSFKQSKRSLFALLKNSFLNPKKVSYKPMDIGKKGKKQFKAFLKGQYIIMPKQIINHVAQYSYSTKTDKSSSFTEKNTTFQQKKPINYSKKKFNRYFFRIFSFKSLAINSSIVTVIFALFLTANLSSASFIPSETFSLPTENIISSLPENYFDNTDGEEDSTYGDVDLSMIKGFTIKNHVVKSGESLSNIAHNSGVDLGTIISINNIRDARKIIAGANIKIPDKNGLMYKVKKGNSLASISASFNVGLNDILDINNIESHVITPGMELFIPNAKLDKFVLKKALGELFIYPTQGRLTSPFGYRKDPFTGIRRMHNGIDIANKTGTAIRASIDGKVSHVGFSSVFGKYIILQHQENYQTLYAHLNKTRVVEGENIVQGQVIGDMGNTGRSTGPHLHFSIYHKQKPVNPHSFLAK